MFKVSTFYVIATPSGTAFYTGNHHRITTDILRAMHFLSKEDAEMYKYNLPDSKNWTAKKVEVFVE